MMRGPKVELILERLTLTTDGGGSSSKSWTMIGKVKGVLTFIRGDERVREGKEALMSTHQLWLSYQKWPNMTEKDELSVAGSTDRYKVLYVDNILGKNRTVKIDLLRIR